MADGLGGVSLRRLFTEPTQSGLHLSRDHESAGRRRRRRRTAGGRRTTPPVRCRRGRETQPKPGEVHERESVDTNMEIRVAEGRTTRAGRGHPYTFDTESDPRRGPGGKHRGNQTNPGNGEEEEEGRGYPAGWDLANKLRKIIGPVEVKGTAGRGKTSSDPAHNFNWTRC